MIAPAGILILYCFSICFAWHSVYRISCAISFWSSCDSSFWIKNGVFKSIFQKSQFPTRIKNYDYKNHPENSFAQPIHISILSLSYFVYSVMPEFLSIYSAYIQNFLLVLLDGALDEKSHARSWGLDWTKLNQIRSSSHAMLPISIFQCLPTSS